MALIESFSGIRGIYKKELTNDLVKKYCHFYYKFLKNRIEKEPLIIIGADTRPSGEDIKKEMTEIFTNMVDIGIASTPMTQLAVREYKADGGVIITASHNEPEYNGLKLLDKDGAALRPKDIEHIITNVKNIKNMDEIEFLTKFPFNEDKPAISKILKDHTTALNKYYKFLIKMISKHDIKLIKNANLKIVLDPNGGTGYIAKKILEEIGVIVISINQEPGEFKRRIEPNLDSLNYLSSVVSKNKADFAAGFDCDADRVEIMLKDKIVSGHYILALITDNILSGSKYPEQETIVINDATSNLIREIAKKYAAAVKEVEVGEINVLDTMLTYDSAVGGEGSSAGVIVPPSRCRDGILTLILILKIIAKKQKQLSEIIKELPSFTTLQTKVEFDPKKHDQIKDKIKNYYLKKGLTIQETGGSTGGLKAIINKKTFIWFRASKTESSVFRIIADAPSDIEAKRLVREAKELIK